MNNVLNNNDFHSLAFDEYIGVFVVLFICFMICIIIAMIELLSNIKFDYTLSLIIYKFKNL